MINAENGAEPYCDPTTDLIYDVTRTMGVEVGAAALSGVAAEPERNPDEAIDEQGSPEALVAAQDASSPDEERRRWLPGQLRTSLRYLHAALSEKEDLYALLPPSQQKVAKWLIETDLTHAEIAEQLGVVKANISTRARFAVANIIQRAKPENLPEELPHPGGAIIPDVQEATVGCILNIMRENLGISMKQLSEDTDVPIPTLSRFLNSHSRPDATRILIHVLDRLGVPPKQTEVLRQWYREERLMHDKRRKV